VRNVIAGDPSIRSDASSPTVAVDYTSLFGGEEPQTSASELVDGWRNALEGSSLNTFSHPSTSGSRPEYRGWMPCPCP